MSLNEWRKSRYKVFNEKIDSFKTHPKYSWLRKYADDAMFYNEGSGYWMIQAEDFIKRIETMSVEFIRMWLEGKNSLKWDEWESFKDNPPFNNSNDSIFSFEDAVQDVVSYLEKKDDDWFLERGDTKKNFLKDKSLIDFVANEHYHCVTRFGNDREWSVEDAVLNDPGFYRKDD